MDGLTERDSEGWRERWSKWGDSDNDRNREKGTEYDKEGMRTTETRTDQKIEG